MHYNETLVDSDTEKMHEFARYDMKKLCSYHITISIQRQLLVFPKVYKLFLILSFQSVLPCKLVLKDLHFTSFPFQGEQLPQSGLYDKVRQWTCKCTSKFLYKLYIVYNCVLFRSIENPSTQSYDTQHCGNKLQHFTKPSKA